MSIGECDDGDDDVTDACVAGCKEASCGDGAVQAGVEECDDGNQVDGDACTPTCKLASGSDAVKDGAETDVDCGGACPKCPKCRLGDACGGQADCDQGVCNDDKLCALPKSCNELKVLQPNTPDGNYLLDPDGEGAMAPLMVCCEMDAGPCGYTMVRFNDAALAGNRDARTRPSARPSGWRSSSPARRCTRRRCSTGTGSRPTCSTSDGARKGAASRVARFARRSVDALGCAGLLAPDPVSLAVLSR